MKLNRPDVPSSRNTITSYGERHVIVNGERRESNVIVEPGRITAWSARDFDALRAQDFEILVPLAPEIVLLATGARQRFPHPRLLGALREAGIGLEVMNLGAACRTYNVLLAEDRRVAAAILFDPR